MNRFLTAGVAGLALIAMTAPTLAQTPAADASLDVNLRGMKPGKGAVVVMLFDSAQSYDSSKAVQSNKTDATAASIKISFTGLTPGRYAIRAFYDVNNNGAYDPDIDSVGFSNHVVMGDGSRPPEFSETSFLLKAGANTQQITFSR